MQDDVTNFFNTLQNTRGTNAKMDFVQQKLSDKIIAKLLEMTFNPYVSFNVVKVPKTKKTELLLKNYIDRAYKSLEPLSNVRLKLALHEIMGNIFSDYL